MSSARAEDKAAMASKRVVENMKEITGASEEDVKAMLQLCGGDANDAVERLLANPFFKVTSKKEKKKAREEEKRSEQGPGRRADSGGFSNGGPTSSRGRGRGGGRGGSGYGGSTSGGRGFGRGPRAPSAPSASTDLSASASHDNGYTAAAYSGPTYNPEPSDGPEWGDSTTTSAPWGETPSTAASTTAAPVPSQPAGVVTAAPSAKQPGTRSLADILKGKSQQPQEPVKPTPVSVTAAQQRPSTPSSPANAAAPATAQSGSFSPATHAPATAAAAPTVASVMTTADQVAAPPPIYHQNAAWGSSDQSKNVFFGKSGAQQQQQLPQPQQQQPQQPPQKPAPPPSQQQPATPTPQQQEQQHQQQEQPQLHNQTLSAADNAVSVHSSQYSGFGAPAVEKGATGNEVDALQLTFGNFGIGTHSSGLTDFGASFAAGAYQPAEPASLLPKQPASEASSIVASQPEAYKPTNYGTYTLHGTAEKITPATSTVPTSNEQPSRQFANFPSAGAASFAAGFGSNFSTSVSQDANQGVYSSTVPDTFSAAYGHDPLKQAAANTYNVNPAGAYTQHGSAYGTHSGSTGATTATYNPSTSKYSPYGPGPAMQQQQPQQQQQQQQQQVAGVASESAGPASQVQPALAASNTGSNGGAQASGVSASSTVPAQVAAHYGNPVTGLPPAMQYGAAGAAYMNPYQHFNPANPAASMYAMYNTYGGYPYPQQGMNAYPPQGTSNYTSPGSNAYAVSHSAHPGSRQPYSHPYSNPAVGGAAAVNQVAAAGYGAASTPNAYGLSAGYDDMPIGGIPGGSSYSVGKQDKDSSGYGMGQQSAGFQGQHVRGGSNNYGGYNMPNQGYPQSGNYGQGPKGNYGGYGRQPYNQQQYGPPGGHSTQSSNYKAL